MTTATLTPLFALFVGAFLQLAAGGLQGILLPVRAQIEGFPSFAIGTMGAMFSVGFVLGCLLVPKLLVRVGHIRVFGVMVALAAFVILLFGMWVDPIVWIIMRAATGFCFAGGAMIVESWLNEQASNENRGTIMSIYMVVNLAAITVGQMTLALFDPATTDLFMITAMILSLALVPTALSTARAPANVTAPRVRLGKLFKTSPVGFIGCLCVGLGNGAFGTLGAVYAQSIGMSATGAALFMTFPVIGGALAQFPIGRLSDRIDRRWVLAGVCTGAVVLATLFVLGVLSTNQTGLMALAFGYGAMVFTMYSLAVAHANDFAPREDFIETSGGLLLVYGIGAIAGPMIASAIMGLVGPAGLFSSTCAVYAGLALFTLYRIGRREALPSGKRDAFEAVPRSGTQVASALDPRAPEMEGHAETPIDQPK